jgi:hypothetical protein
MQRSVRSAWLTAQRTEVRSAWLTAWNQASTVDPDVLIDDLLYEFDERAPRLSERQQTIERGLSREQQLWDETPENLVIQESSHAGVTWVRTFKHQHERGHPRSGIRRGHVAAGEQIMQHVPLMPMIEETFECNKLKPVISIGDGDHRVNGHTVSVMVRRNGDLAEAFDNCEGAQDCTLPHIGDPILLRLREGKCRGLHVAIDCKSFSPIAEQVRSMAHVRGM